jgi:hypothetical protein
MHRALFCPLEFMVAIGQWFTSQDHKVQITENTFAFAAPFVGLDVGDLA